MARPQSNCSKLLEMAEKSNNKIFIKLLFKKITKKINFNFYPLFFNNEEIVKQIEY